MYAGKLEGVGFKRGESCGVVFYYKGRDISMAVHGDDFTLMGLEEDLFWLRDLMKAWFERKVRAIWEADAGDDKEVVILGRRVTYGKDRIEYEADRKLGKYFGTFWNGEGDQGA